MDYVSFNRFCKSLRATSYVVQWGGSHVWKVGKKVFAVGGWYDETPAFTFKTSRDDFEFLTALPGIRPAPYFASRGMSWVQHFGKPGLPDRVLKEHLCESHRIVSSGLTKQRQRDLDLDQK